MTGFFRWSAEADTGVNETGWRRVVGAFLGVAAFLGVVLVGCGGTTTIESQLVPGRFIVFGDALSDLGQAGGKRYTVNDGSFSNWTERVAVRYNKTITASVTGGLSFATGNARIVQKPDAAGNTATLSLKEQIDRFLGTNSFRADDVILITAGMADILANYAANGATQTTVVASQQAARDYAEQIKRVVGAGAKQVIVMGAYDLGLTPWGQSTTRAGFLSEVTRLFDERLLVDITGLGANVLYLDALQFFTPMFLSPISFGLGNSADVACNSIDGGAGIGTGLGKVNSALCTTATLVINTVSNIITSQTVTFTTTGSVTTSATATITASAVVSAPAAYAAYVFADGVYLSTGAQAAFGDFAHTRIASRW